MRKFTVIDCPQHLDDGLTANPDWLAARIARVTGTGANAMLAEGKGVSRRNLKIRLVAEHLTGRSFDDNDFQSRAMEQGLKREPEAVFAYERAKGVIVQRCGFCAHVELFAGCSVDGYIGDFDGLISVKCPELPQHLDWMRDGPIVAAHRRQILHEQFITGAAWTDFVSYNPELGEKLSLVVRRIPRVEKEITEHEAALRAFLAEVEAEYLSLRTMTDRGTVLAFAAGAA